MRFKKLLVSLAAAGAVVVPAAAVVHASYSYTAGSCPTGNGCMSNGTSYSTSNTTSSGCSMVGWNFSTGETGYVNLANFSFAPGCAAPNTGTVDNKADQSRNRNSTSVRTICWYSGLNAGASYSDPYSSTITWRTMTGSFQNTASSYKLVAAGSSC
jgi:hypothetical protein